MTSMKPPGYTDVLPDYEPYEDTETTTLASIPRTYVEQRGVQQILDAKHLYNVALARGETGIAELAEITRISQSMQRVTDTLRAVTWQGIMQAKLKTRIVEERPWNTKKPENVVGKVCVNAVRGNVSSVKDIHRGTFVVNDVSEFAETLVETLNDPNVSKNTVAYVERFDSPHGDARLQELGRKVIVGFLHEDGECYTGELQIFDEEGAHIYQETRCQFENRRDQERIDAEKAMLGSLALRATLRDI